VYKNDFDGYLNISGLGVFRGDGFEAVRFIVPGDFAIAKADYGEAFGDSPSCAVPPVAAYRSARDVMDSAEENVFIDVSMSLEDGEGVVFLEDGNDVVSVGYCELGVDNG